MSDGGRPRDPSTVPGLSCGQEGGGWRRTAPDGGADDRRGFPLGEPPPGRDGSEGDTDWFGFPLDRPRQPVPCPRCGASFTDGAAYGLHLRSDHGVRAPSGRSAPRGEQPALGRNRRRPLARRLRAVPLVLVVLVNVALAVAVVGGLSAVGPQWWDDLMAQPWSQVVLIPLLWPTIVFLALRGLD